MQDALPKEEPAAAALKAPEVPAAVNEPNQRDTGSEELKTIRRVSTNHPCS